MIIIREATLVYKRHNIDLPTKVITSADSAATILRSLIPDGPQEHMVTMAMDNTNKVIGVHRTIGGMDMAIVDVPNILRFLLLSCANSVICGHNHPSGDTKASRQDYDVTGALKNACTTIGIRFLDSLIVTDSGYSSILLP